MPRILSVSYDATLLRTRQMVLESRGYEVVSAEGFTAALEKCKDGKYDLIHRFQAAKDRFLRAP